MTTIVRRNNLAPRAFSKNEFLTPFDRLFDDMLGSMFPTVSRDLGEDFFHKGSYPKVNVIDNDNDIIIEAAVPGMSKEDITLNVKDDVLTISGKSNQNDKYTNGSFLRREIKKSRFERSFALGENLNKEAITASCNSGILVLTLPKLQPEDKKVSSYSIPIE